ncbi:Calcium-binding protein 1 [Folsomia candida]|uniref:Calcium-binding protein 1 n=1 Tax=Folsomia candida TaxID=158441 RepID=A0A226DE49_FOLCA|nr:Calcium-binding protein 1 [Folsomia candida]
MSTNRRIPRTEVELAFRALPTYNGKDETCSVSDLEPLLTAIHYIRTPQQFAEYQNFWNANHNGIIPLDVFAKLMASIDDNVELMRIHVISMDTDHDGFIDEAEFKNIVAVLLAHNPDFRILDYKNFVEEADTNKDGLERRERNHDNFTCRWKIFTGQDRWKRKK